MRPNTERITETISSINAAYAVTVLNLIHSKFHALMTGFVPTKMLINALRIRVYVSDLKFIKLINPLNTYRHTFCSETYARASIITSGATSTEEENFAGRCAHR